jgi:cytochrome c5
VSTKNLDLNDRADVDLVTLYGEDRTTRVPRFMIWRGSLKFYYNKDGSLSSKADTNRLLVPTSIFSVTKIKRIELTRASVLYPETELHLRTNPAASRGEKLFTQSCLACHGLPSAPKLKVETLTDAQLNDFVAKHKSQGAMMLDARATRGLIAYRDALVLEHSGVKPKP